MLKTKWIVKRKNNDSFISIQNRFSKWILWDNIRAPAHVLTEVSKLDIQIENDMHSNGFFFSYFLITHVIRKIEFDLIHSYPNKLTERIKF